MVFVLQTASQELKSCRHKARYDGWLLNILKSQLCLHVRNHSWITRCLNKRIQPFVNFSSRNFRYRSASPMLKKTQTNSPVPLKLLQCVLSGPKCTHTLQSLFPSSSTQEFGYQSSMSASIQWSCVTLNQTASKSIVWERAVRRYLGPLPLAQGCIWAQASAISPCLSCIIDTAVPGYSLCWSCDCFLSWICGLASDLSCHYDCFCVIWYFVIQQAVESVNPGLLWILICYNYSPPPSTSFTQKAAELPSLCLQELTYVKSLSSQHTLPPHLHHASRSLMVCSFLSFFLCWNE